MEHSTHQVSSRLPLEQLIAGAVSELERLGYSRRSLNRYWTVWRRLAAFCPDMNVIDEYCEDVVVKFYSVYGMQEEERLKAGDGWRRHIEFALKLLEDFARDGQIERNVTDMQRVQVPGRMMQTVRDYDQYCRDRLHLRPITRSDRMRARSHHIREFPWIKEHHVFRPGAAGRYLRLCDLTTSGGQNRLRDRFQRAWFSAISSAARNPAPRSGSGVTGGPRSP